MFSLVSYRSWRETACRNGAVRVTYLLLATCPYTGSSRRFPLSCRPSCVAGRTINHTPHRSACLPTQHLSSLVLRRHDDLLHRCEAARSSSSSSSPRTQLDGRQSINAHFIEHIEFGLCATIGHVRTSAYALASLPPKLYYDP